MNNKAMNCLSYGLFVLTTKADGQDNGCIINTVQQVTSEPNRISITVNKANYTHDMILKSGVFTVSTISQQASFDLFKHFGFQSGRNVNKFADFADCEIGANGVKYVTKGTNSYLSGKVFQTVDLGTHTMFIADVTDMEVLGETASATYSFYHSNIKPKPLAQDTAQKTKTVWRCTICGYEYEGEELPADYICPLCKHPASDFEKA